MDALLRDFFAGDDQQEKRSRAQDFVSRYEDGSPSEGFSDDEAVQNYDEVAGKLSPEEYQEVATQAFERMSPEQRREFGQMLMQQGNENGMPMSTGNQYEDPRQLAQMTSQLQQQQPAGLAGLLGTSNGVDTGGTGSLGGLLGGLTGGGQQGGGLGGMLSGLTGGNQQGGFNQAQSGGMGSMMSNPIVRAAIGGIAAMAFKQIMGRR